MTRSAPPRPTFVALALLIVVSAVLLLSEGMTRIAARPGTALEARLRPYDPFAVLVEPSGATGFKPKPGVTLTYRNGTKAHINSARLRGPVPAMPKPPGLTRIVLLGGSTTFGWGANDDATIAAHMQAALDTLAPGRRFEVLNAAFDGFDTGSIIERLNDDILALQPDLLVINIGINDVRVARYAGLVPSDLRTQRWVEPLRVMREEEARGGPYLRSRIKHWSYLVRLGLLTRDRLASGAPVPEDTSATTGARYPIYMEAADRFDRNAREIGRLAAQRGIAVLFSTPPSSLRTKYEPTATSRVSYWLNDAEETQVYRDTLASRLRVVADSLAASGLRTTYVRPSVPVEEFLDDAHLTGAGNRLVAAEFTRAILALLAEAPAAAR